MINPINGIEIFYNNFEESGIFGNGSVSRGFVGSRSVEFGDLKSCFPGTIYVFRWTNLNFVNFSDCTVQPEFNNLTKTIFYNIYISESSVLKLNAIYTCDDRP